MTLADQVCSLALAKDLKALGVKQKSQFWWMNENTSEPNIHFDPYLNPYVWTSAFTASELSMMLPFSVDTDYFLTVYKCVRAGWWIEYQNRECDTTRDLCFWSQTLVDSLAKMLIRLLEEEIININ